MRQIVSGRIEPEGREPRNVIVEVTESETGTMVALRDDEGIFLECHPDDEDSEVSREGGGEGELGGGDGEGGRSDGARPDDAEDHAGLRAELDRLAGDNAVLVAANAGLKRENEELKVKVKEERNRYKSVWRESCEQLLEHDALMAEKEVEVEALRARLAELEP